MAIVTSFSICQPNGCKSLIFNDTTGAYSATNIYGYGSPNESISGATAVIRVTLADSTFVDIPMAGFPTTDKDKEFTILGTQLGYSDGIIKDQIITLKYTVTTTTPTIITQSAKKGLLCNVECCVQNMVETIDFECDECYESSKPKTQKAYLMLAGLKYSSGCGNETAFNKTLTQLNKLCANSECSNCK